MQMSKRSFTINGLTFKLHILSNHSSQVGFLEYGRMSRKNASAYVVLIDGHLIFESYESLPAFTKYTELLPN